MVGSSGVNAVLSEQFVLQGHIRLRLQTDAGTEDVRESTALLGEGVDDGGAGRGERCLWK